MDVKFRKLLNNTRLFAIGNISFKLAQYFVISMCTYTVSTSEFGIADTIIQTVAMLVPIFSMDISEALFRFVMDRNGSVDIVLTNCIFIEIIGLIFSIICFPIVQYLTDSYLYSAFILVLCTVEIFQLNLKEYIRAVGKTELYVKSSIINAVVQLFFCIVFVIHLRYGLEGYLAVIFLGYIFEILYCLMNCHIIQYIRKSKIDFDYMKSLIKYSMPLVPNKIMWWVISASDRYLLLIYCGASATGLYAIASKVPAVITILVGFFMQAWQVSAIEEDRMPDNKDFHDKIFNLMWFVNAVVCILVLLSIKLLLKYLVSDQYYVAWELAPFLILAAAFNTLQSFIGVEYTIKKNSLGALKTTSLAAVVNILLNVLFIHYIGVLGATIASFISYLVVCVYRFLDTKAYEKYSNTSIQKLALSYIVMIIFVFLVSVFKFNLEISSIILLLFMLMINISNIKRYSRHIINSIFI